MASFYFVNHSNYMRVMCIKDVWDYTLPGPYPEVGESYTVVGTIERFDILYYHLEECHPKCAFDSSYFIPLSDIDEKEMIRENINIETI